RRACAASCTCASMPRAIAHAGATACWIRCASSRRYGRPSAQIGTASIDGATPRGASLARMSDDAPPDRPLRQGWTTGACATAAAKAAFVALATGAFPDPVTIALPRGQRPSFTLAERALAGGRASAGVVKDAGDDPDVTHGALVRAIVERGPAGSGV